MTEIILRTAEPESERGERIMNRNRHFFIFVLIMTVLATALAGCGGGTSASSDQTSVPVKSTDSSEHGGASLISSKRSESTGSAPVTESAVSVEEESSVPADAESAVPVEAESAPAEDGSVTAIRQRAKESGSVCAIIDLGYRIDASDGNEILKFSNGSAQTAAYPFLASLSNAAESGPGAFYAYCFVPADRETTIEFYENSLGSDGTLERGARIYSDDTGSPVILYCDSGDVTSNVSVTIRDCSGDGVTDYQPMYSGYDGSLILDDGTGNTLYDATA